MTFVTEAFRRQEKILTTPGQVPTVPTVANQTLPGWLTTDIYKGEWCFNNADGLWYSRNETGIVGPYATKSQIDDLQNEIDSINAVVDNYVHPQNTPSTVWTITHGMNRKPSVTVIDSAGEENMGEINYTSNNTLTITFSAAFAGEAYLN